MRPPAEAAKDMPRVLANGCERIVESLSSYGVIDHVEPCAAGVSGKILFHRKGLVVDRSCSEPCRDLSFIRGDGRKDPRSEGVSNLHRDVSDATSAGVNQHRLPRVNTGAIEQVPPRP